MVIRLWGTETVVNTNIAGEQSQPAVASLKDGGLVIAWVTGTGASQLIRFQVFAADGAPVGAEQGIALTGTNTTQTSPDITALSNGFFTIGYSEVSTGGGQDTLVAEFAPNGGFLASTVIDGNVGNSTAPQLDFGSFTTAVGYSNGDIQLQFRDINNLPTGPSGILNTQTSGIQDQLALDFSGSFGAAVWRDNGAASPGLRIKGFNNFSLAGTEAVLQNDAFDISTFDSTTVGGADVAMIDFTRAVVAWEENTNFSGFQNSFAIKAAFFDTASGAITPIPLGFFGSLTGAAQPKVMVLPDGRFAIGYVEKFDNLIDITTGPVKIQVFNAAGQTEGSAFTVNNALEGNISDPQFTVLADGRIAVTWTANADARSDGDGSGIIMQIVDPRDGIIDGGFAADTLMGHDIVNDHIRGFSGDDVINGLGGADALYGGDGEDQLIGGRGDDVLFGGTGNDDARGGNGEDTIKGENGNDVLRGGKDDDELDGGKDNDVLIGGTGADTLNGGGGSDTASYIDASTAVRIAIDGSLVATGDAAGDTLVSIENLFGSAFADTLSGNAGANTIEGRNGSDTIDGKAGSDRIIGGTGNDILTGGTGNDTFVYNTRNEAGDTITDFSSTGTGNNDRFEFKGSVFGGLAAGGLLIEQFQNNGSSAAIDDNVRFIYNQSTRQFFFDVDGEGGTAALLIATLQAGATMNLADILIV